MSRMASRVASLGTTIFAEMTALATAKGALNLGQGAPDFNPPPEVMTWAQEALQTPCHQYAHGWGYPEVRSAIVEHARHFYGQTLDPQREVLVTNGATEGIFAAMQGLVEAGDEVILLEPFYDSYLAGVLMAGGVPRFVPLHAPTWTFDPQELRAAFSPRTKLILLNTPHNPTGKVFSRAELQFIADLCQEFDVLALSDEVYEHIVFEGAQHVRLATLDGMAERTLTLSSLGKTFSVTGWKIGWALGSADLVSAVNRAKQYISYASASVLQWAAVAILNWTPHYVPALQAMYSAKRDLLLSALQASPLIPSPPQGTYFIMADTSALKCADDRAFAAWLVEAVGVACIPPSAFYNAAHRSLAQNWARFGFCKTDETLHAAAHRLERLTHLA